MFNAFHSISFIFSYLKVKTELYKGFRQTGNEIYFIFFADCDDKGIKKIKNHKHVFFTVLEE